MKIFLINIIIELGNSGNKGNREIRENRACFNFKTLALHYSCISLIPLYPYSPYNRRASVHMDSFQSYGYHF